MNILSEDQTIRELDERWGIDRPQGRRVVQIAREHGVKATPVAKGFITVQRVNNNSYIIEPGKKVVAETRPQVAARTAGQYTSPAKKTGRQASRPAPAKTIPAQGRNRTMAKAAVAEPEVEETEAKDYTGYADKAPTATMTDFATWLKDEVGLEFGSTKEEAAFDKGVHLGGTLRMEFQRSDFNISQREARRAERAAAAEAEAEPAEAEAPAPKRGAKGRAAAKAPAPAAAKAPARGRGRRAAATAEAPF